MRRVKLSVIAELPTYVAWCEKKYPEYALEWFKTPEEFQEFFEKSHAYTRIVLTEYNIVTDYPCIDLRKINLYSAEQNLTQKIDNILMYDTLTTIFSSNVARPFV